MTKFRKALFAAVLAAGPVAETPALAADPQSVFSAIGSSEEASSAIRKATQVRDVDVIPVTSLAKTGGRLETTILRNRPKIEELQAALQSNAALNAALEARKVDVTRVVAADMDGSGRLTVYVK
jgi:hypothetical protein